MARQAPSGPGRGGEGQGGVPDGLLVGAPGLPPRADGPGLDGHGPGRTVRPRRLAGRRHVHADAPGPARTWPSSRTDLPGAWPDTPPGKLSGYGLFWGLFIGEVMVLLVLTVFVVGVVARWRLVRRQRRAAAGTATTASRDPVRTRPGGPGAPSGRDGHRGSPAGARSPAPSTTPLRTAAKAAPDGDSPRSRVRAGSRRPRRVRARAAPRLRPHAPCPAHPLRRLRRPAAPPSSRPSGTPTAPPSSSPRTPPSGPRRRTPARKLGPVLVYDPGHLCDTPARLHWSPAAGCEDPHDRRCPGRRAPRPGPPPGQGRRGRRRHRARPPPVLAARRRRGRPPLPPGPPLGPGRRRPRTRPRAPYAPQGGLRARRAPGVRAHRAPRTPGDGPGTDRTGLRRPLLGPHPRSVHTQPSRCARAGFFRRRRGNALCGR